MLTAIISMKQSFKEKQKERLLRFARNDAGMMKVVMTHQKKDRLPACLTAGEPAGRHSR